MNSFRFYVCRFVPVAELIVHPEHNRILRIHDIALLKLGLKSFQLLSLKLRTNFRLTKSHQLNVSCLQSNDLCEIERNDIVLYHWLS